MDNKELVRGLDEAKAMLLDVRESIQQMKCKYDLMASDLHDCVNELCLRCGSYHESHKGACDGCRWLKVKEDMRK